MEILQKAHDLRAYNKKINKMFPRLSDAEMLERLEPNNKVKKIVLDTDTYNEVDDQFALVYALCSPELKVEAVYAAPFYNERSNNPEDGMIRSYNEILRLLGKMNIKTEGLVFEGSRYYLENIDSPVNSPAVDDLIKKARISSDSDPLYVVAIGAITNIASAIIKAPDIIKNIVVVWLGCHAHNQRDNYEFNLAQDLEAARLVFDCGVPLVQVPCYPVASHLLTTVPELEANLSGKNEVCDALIELFKAYEPNHFGWAKEIWDISAVAYVINTGLTGSEVVHAPIITDQLTWSFNNERHFMRVVTWLNRNDIFRDMFKKIASGG